MRIARTLRRLCGLRIGRRSGSWRETETETETESATESVSVSGSYDALRSERCPRSERTYLF